MSEPILASAIVGHLVGDYLLQSDWMAIGKKQSWLPCAVHCAIWTACVVLFAGWWVSWIAVALFVTHYAQDRWSFVRWYVNLVKGPKFAEPPMAPWSMIVVDNVWHILVIFLLWRLTP